MNIKLIFNRFRYCDHGSFAILASCWISGLVTGIVLSLLFQDAGMPVLLASFAAEQKPYCVFLVNILPVTIVSISINNRLIPICYPLFFFNAVCHGFCGMLPLFMFGSSAWLIRSLFLFSGIGVEAIMWWLLMRHITCKQTYFSKDVILSFLMVCGISLIDLYMISPQLSSLFTHF